MDGKSAVTTWYLLYELRSLHHHLEAIVKSKIIYLFGTSDSFFLPFLFVVQVLGSIGDKRSLLVLILWLWCVEKIEKKAYQTMRLVIRMQVTRSRIGNVTPARKITYGSRFYCIDARKQGEIMFFKHHSGTKSIGGWTSFPTVCQSVYFDTPWV